MAAFSFRQLTMAVIVTAFLLIHSVSLAEVRVIVEYDSNEHRLLRVVDLPPERSAPVSDHLQGKSNNTLTPATARSKVKLLWFNADGAKISTTYIDDPRLTHAPLTGTDQAPTVVSLDTGAFMVSGPSQSAVLEIHLPANVSLGLDEQFWRMMLVR